MSVAFQSIMIEKWKLGALHLLYKCTLYLKVFFNLPVCLNILVRPSGEEGAMYSERSSSPLSLA